MERGVREAVRVEEKVAGWKRGGDRVEGPVERGVRWKVDHFKEVG